MKNISITKKMLYEDMSLSFPFLSIQVAYSITPFRRGTPKLDAYNFAAVIATLKLVNCRPFSSNTKITSTNRFYPIPLDNSLIEN